MSLDGTAALEVIDFDSVAANASVKTGAGTGITKAEIQTLKMAPIPMRSSLVQGTGNKKRANADLAWGMQFERLDSPTSPNKNS